MEFVDAAQQVDELFFFFGVERVQEGGMDGREPVVALFEEFFTFFSYAESCGAAIVWIGSFCDDAFLDETPGDLDAGGIFDKEFAAEFFFIGVIHDGDVDYG